MQLVDNLIEVEDDHFGALQVLHPGLYDYFLAHMKKLQRKVETYELKATVNKKDA